MVVTVGTTKYKVTTCTSFAVAAKAFLDLITTKPEEDVSAIAEDLAKVNLTCSDDDKNKLTKLDDKFTAANNSLSKQTKEISDKLGGK